FLKPARSGRTVVEAEGLEVAIGGRVLLRDATFAVERGEHVALVGPNGSGKTTLLERLVRGEGVRIGHGVQIGYFSQQEMELDTRGSVLQCVQAMTGLARPDAQSLLGRFLFSGWDAHEKQVAVLSGGERRRLALAVTVASGANFLVLDEPTNHLDLESREALEAALDAFPGTLLLVSHDRALLDAIAERTLAVEDGTLRSYDGGWADYIRRRDELAASPPQSEPKAKPRKAATPAKPKGPSELERIEVQIGARLERQGEHLRAEREGEGAPLLLLGHLDTVWARGTLARLPWRVEDGRAYGPGAFDMKAGLVVLLEAIRRAGTPRALRIFMTADEEVGSPTARPLLEHAAAGAAAALVVEPPDAAGNLKTARKGLGRFRPRVTGR